jgi:hypothetical protein
MRRICPGEGARGDAPFWFSSGTNGLDGFRFRKPKTGIMASFAKESASEKTHSIKFHKLPQPTCK